MDEIDRDIFSERLADLNRDLEAELIRRSKLELELKDDQADPMSYELVQSLMGRFNALLSRSPFPQRKTLLHLIVKRITLDDRKHIRSIDLTFNEETEKHFLSVAPSSEHNAEGAFPMIGKAPNLNKPLNFSIEIGSEVYSPRKIGK